MEFSALILAAGKGTRMKSDLPKVIHPLLGRPLVEYGINAVKALQPEQICLVIGHKASLVQEKLADLPFPLNFVIQKEQLGTGHAVQQGADLFQDYTGPVLILPGDAPLLTAETLGSLLEYHQSGGYSATILTTLLPNPHGYGRIIRDAAENVVAIVEEKDATPEERLIKEVNSAVYCFDSTQLYEALGAIDANNAQGEYYLTDVIAVLRQAGKKVGALAAAEPTEVLGVNTRVELAEAGKTLWRRKALELMLNGVTIMDPDTTYIDPETEIGPDTIIYPCVVIARGCQVGSNCQIGPFAYLRPGTQLADGVKVGDFVEIKNSQVGEGSKVPHHTYLGDAIVGQQVNIGAGTITCNFDGVAKHKTYIADRAFIGSNSNLVAPLTIGEGSYVAAGSTITKDVPAESLGVARSRQCNKDGWARQRKKPQ